MSVRYLDPVLAIALLALIVAWHWLLLAVTVRARAEDPAVFEAMGSPLLVPGFIALARFLYAPGFPGTSSRAVARQRRMLQWLFPVVVIVVVLMVWSRLSGDFWRLGYAD